MKTIAPGYREGSILVPASKSYTQRILLAAALAQGTTKISNLSTSADETAMLDFIQLFGASVESNGKDCTVVGNKLFPKRANVNVGESGLGIRLITCVLAALGGKFEIAGKGSLKTRPMTEFEALFSNHNIQITTSDGKIPLQIEGKLSPGNYSVDGSLSSQFVSGMLMALPLLDGNSTLEVTELNSKPYVQITLAVLQEFGISVSHNVDYTFFEISGNQTYQATEIEVESDWSSAAAWFVASALGHDIQIHGLKKNTLQADRSILTALENAGCTIWEENNVFTCSEAKKPFSFDATDAPDLFPVLVALASFMEGKSEIIGAERLVHKESNRALVLQKEFGKLGVKIELEGDLMRIEGAHQVYGKQVSSNNDHRIAMALAIAGLNADGNMVVEQAGSVQKSYPQFWEHLEKLTFISS